MKLSIIKLSSFFMCMLATGASFAGTIIQADKANYNYKTKIYTYTGHVKITEKTAAITTKLTGDIVIIANSVDQKITALGNLAHYDTLPNDKKHAIHAQAQRIEIYPSQQKILLLGQGKMLQDNNSLTGPRLEYLIKKQALIAFPSKKNQTTLVIKPQSQQHS